MNPLVTVIMPAYNVADFIDAAIRSVISQSYTNWELIVIDNASNDGTKSVAEKFNDPRIVVCEETKQGTSYARNKGLQMAKGDFICFLDADDILPIESISLRVERMLASAECVAVDGGVGVYDESMMNKLRTFIPDISGNVAHEMALLAPRCFVTVSWMIRKEKILNTVFPEGWTHFEDRIFFHEIAAKGDYAFVQNEIYRLRKRKNSSMTDIDALEKSYIKFMNDTQPRFLSAEECSREKKKFHSIFFRTFLKEGKWIKSLSHLFRSI
jgi:teichuronic acid biosynthesis glycosyltransferase TuaG